MRNYQSFTKAFYLLIYNNGIDLEDRDISIEDNDYGVALQTINTKAHLNKYINAVKLINKKSRSRAEAS